MAREEDEDQNKDNRENGVMPETAEPERRRFVKGAVAAPVILTVASRPAMGGNLCTPSGFLSGNLSTPAISCNGRSPGYWRMRFPEQYLATTFSQVFGGVWHDQFTVAWNPAITLKEVLFLTDADDQYKFGWHAVACYFNGVYASQMGYYMTAAEVVNIVQQILTLGVFSDPATGLTMDALETVEFFKNTYH